MRSSIEQLAEYEESATEPWSEPIPFGREPLPEFPTDALPDEIQRYVLAVSEETQTPVDLAAMLSLAALATSCAGWLRVQVAPGWDEPTNLYLAVALGPGTGKSPVLRKMMRPIEAFERQLIEQSASEIARQRTERELLEQQVLHAKKKLSNTNDELTRTEVFDLVDQLEAAEVSSTPRLIVDDITPERLAAILHEQRGTLAVISAEGGGPFEMMAGRYSQNGTANLEVYLKGHSGDALRVDRSNGTTLHVDRPALTLGLAIQPQVLHDLGRRAAFRGRGLLGRFLYAIPTSILGRRSHNPTPAPKATLDAYDALLGDLLTRWERAGAEPLMVRLAPEAEQMFQRFKAELEPRLGDDGDLAGLQDWGSKLHGSVPRLAGLLHAAEHPSRAHLTIGAGSLARALAITEYLVAHAKSAFWEMGSDPEARNAERALAWIRRNGLDRFTRRDLFNGLRDRSLKRVSEIDGPIRLLVDRDFIRPLEPDEPGPRGGRPRSPEYLVNPLTHDIRATQARPAGSFAGSAGSAGARESENRHD